MNRYGLSDFLTGGNSKFILTVDCEGPIFDKNLMNNVMNLERFLELTTRHDVYTILFITPYFADMLSRLNLVNKIKQNYKVIFGLHIHPNDFPDVIQEKCPFARKDIDHISFYSCEEQKIMISESLKYLQDRGIYPIEAFRGGYFSINDDTAKALVEVSDIRLESHNIYRPEYKITGSFLKSLPVYGFDKDTELRLEYFDTEKLVSMTREAYKNNSFIVGITHSYMFDDEDYHYKRDVIEGSIYSRLEAILQELSAV